MSLRPLRSALDLLVEGRGSHLHTVRARGWLVVALVLSVLAHAGLVMLIARSARPDAARGRPSSAVSAQALLVRVMPDRVSPVHVPSGQPTMGTWPAGLASSGRIAPPGSRAERVRPTRGRSVRLRPSLASQLAEVGSMHLRGQAPGESLAQPPAQAGEVLLNDPSLAPAVTPEPPATRQAFGLPTLTALPAGRAPRWGRSLTPVSQSDAVGGGLAGAMNAAQRAQQVQGTHAWRGAKLDQLAQALAQLTQSWPRLVADAHGVCQASGMVGQEAADLHCDSDELRTALAAQVSPLGGLLAAYRQMDPQVQGFDIAAQHGQYRVVLRMAWQ